MKVVVEEGRWLATAPGTPVEDLEQRFRAAVVWEGNLLLVLEDDDAGPAGPPPIVGSIGLHPGPVAGVLSLGMWILPAWRGRGGGRQLMTTALAQIPEGAHKIELEVFPDNEAAIALYRAFGFEEEGLRRDHYRRAGELRSALIMARLLPRPGSD